QLGSAKLPFATIADAVDFASAGDTVRIRSALYRESVSVDHDVIIEGETSAGRPPRLSPGSNAPAFTINDATVELPNLRFDGFATAIDVPSSVRVLLDSVDLTMPGCSTASVTLGSVGELRVIRSHLNGADLFCGESGSLGITDSVGVGLAVFDSVT